METSEELIREIARRQELLIEMLRQLHAEIRVLKSRQNMIDGDPLLNMDEVCHILNVSDRQVRRYREENKLTGFLFGGRRLYRKSQVDAFVADMEREAREKELRSLGYYDEKPK